MRALLEDLRGSPYSPDDVDHVYYAVLKEAMGRAGSKEMALAGLAVLSQWASVRKETGM
jgi:hypothetical protein